MVFQMVSLFIALLPSSLAGGDRPRARKALPAREQSLRVRCSRVVLVSPGGVFGLLNLAVICVKSGLLLQYSYYLLFLIPCPIFLDSPAVFFDPPAFFEKNRFPKTGPLRLPPI